VAATNYVVDANVYITAFNSYYHFEFSTKFWEILKRCSLNGRIVSIDRIRDELLAKIDNLSEWVKTLPEETFVKTDRIDVIEEYRKLQNWANKQPQFIPAAKSAFATGNDAWIVAYALAGGHTVVTLEALKPDIRKGIKIPNVCEAFGIPYINTFQMLHALKEKLG
jgi:hypothetical protein